jgi:hypothetical protein
MFNSGAGHTTNIGSGVNYFAKLIATLSPIRYGTEMLMYRILSGSSSEKFVLNHLGYTNGDQNCIIAMVILGLLTFFAGWVNLLKMNRYD